jgi:hypothetical protein
MPFRYLARGLCALVSVGATAAGAQTLLDAKVEPASVSTGRPVTLTANFSNADNPNCGVRVHWGDGQQMDLKINQAKDVPLVARHSYAKPGSYTVMVEPKTQGLSMKCVGTNQRVALTVTAPPPAASAPAKTATASPKGPACAAPWKLDAKSVNRRSGAYTCNAKAGTAAPAPAPECPGALTYFHNAKRGQYGCRP